MDSSSEGHIMTSLSYGRIFCLESQKIDGTHQRYNHYFKIFYFNFSFLYLSFPFFYLKFDFSLLKNLNRNLKK